MRAQGGRSYGPYHLGTPLVITNLETPRAFQMWRTRRGSMLDAPIYTT